MADDEPGTETMNVPCAQVVFDPLTAPRLGHLAVFGITMTFIDGARKPGVALAPDTASHVNEATHALRIEDAERLATLILNTCADIRREMAIDAMGAAGPVGEG